MKTIGNRFSSAAAMLLVVASASSMTLHAGDRQDRDHVVKAEKATTWQVRSNGCALGNDPPPGTNCGR